MNNNCQYTDEEIKQLTERLKVLEEAGRKITKTWATLPKGHHTIESVQQLINKLSSDIIDLNEVLEDK